MTATVTASSTTAEIRAALAAAGIEAPAKARKQELLDLLHPETALSVEPAPARAEKPAAKQGKAATLEVRIAPKFTRVYAANGARVARVVTGSPLTDGTEGPRNTRFDDGSWIANGSVDAVKAAIVAASA
jgi:hypothetical protein